MNVSVRIQHHPSRAELLTTLLPRLNGLDDVKVITDPGGPKPSSWRTHRLCLEAVPDDASHLLVLQDDAWPCNDFAARALAAIAERPSRIIAFFVPGVSHLARRFAIARKRGDRWLEFPQTSFVPLVGVVYPAGHAREIPRFADAKRIHPGRADDAIVGMYARARRLQTAATVPCLVEHLDGVPSAMGMRSGTGAQHRVAAWFTEHHA